METHPVVKKAHDLPQIAAYPRGAQQNANEDGSDENALRSRHDRGHEAGVGTPAGRGRIGAGLAEAGRREGHSPASENVAG